MSTEAQHIPTKSWGLLYSLWQDLKNDNDNSAYHWIYVFYSTPPSLLNYDGPVMDYWLVGAGESRKPKLSSSGVRHWQSLIRLPVPSMTCCFLRALLWLTIDLQTPGIRFKIYYGSVAKLL